MFLLYNNVWHNTLSQANSQDMSCTFYYLKGKLCMQGDECMNQKEIGKFIAECRKEHNFTQEQLAEKLGVSSKSISRWENGNTMPDYSILADLCKNLNISINELFSCQKLPNERYKEEADKNLFTALENSTLNLKDKISYYKKKWLKEHILKILLGIAIWVTAMLILKFNDGEHLIGYFAGLLAVLIYSLLHNNMMTYVEKHIYHKVEKNYTGVEK